MESTEPFLWNKSILPVINMSSLDEHQLIETLTAGFGALLSQVQELAKRNTDLERRLARVRDEVSTAIPATILVVTTMMKLYSSRSGAIYVAVIEHKPIF